MSLETRNFFEKTCDVCVINLHSILCLLPVLGMKYVISLQKIVHFFSQSQSGSEHH